MRPGRVADHSPLSSAEVLEELSYTSTTLWSGFGGLVVSVLASGTQDRGFKPGRKNPQHAFLRKGSKAVCPMSQICGTGNYMEFGFSGEICR